MSFIAPDDLTVPLFGHADVRPNWRERGYADTTNVATCSPIELP
jgi:hypothetical protein